MNNKNNWSLFEVFVRSKQGLSHRHVGSLHAPDAEMAINNARDVYTRRNEGVSIWAVRSEEVVASAPSKRGPLFEPSNSKVYRHPTFYKIPKEARAGNDLKFFMNLKAETSEDAFEKLNKRDQN